MQNLHSSRTLLPKWTGYHDKQELPAKKVVSFKSLAGAHSYITLRDRNNCTFSTFPSSGALLSGKKYNSLVNHQTGCASRHSCSRQYANTRNICYGLFLPFKRVMCCGSQSMPFSLNKTSQAQTTITQHVCIS